jgi:hypothetical protein
MRLKLRADLDEAIKVKTAGRTYDSSVSACSTTTLKTRYVQLTPERIVRLINAAFPVICQFHDTPGSSSSHVYVLAGYRANPEFPNGIELFARNSNEADLIEYGRELNCYEAAVVYGAEEELRLNEALSI